MKTIIYTRVISLASHLVLLILLSCSWQDHPPCCPTEKQAYDTAKKRYDEAFERAIPTRDALNNATLELIRLEALERACVNSASNPTVECRDQRVAANNQQTEVNNKAAAHKPFKDALDNAEIQRSRASTALSDCEARNNCSAD